MHILTSKDEISSYDIACKHLSPRNGCATSEDMLWKLDALQSFIRELHWPEEVFAEHLDHRLKLMAADMIEAAARRYWLGLCSQKKTHPDSLD